MAGKEHEQELLSLSEEVLEAPQFLDPYQSLYDQPPFDKLLANETLLPANLLRDTSDESIRTTKIHLIKAVINLQPFSYSDSGYVMTGADQTRLAKALLPDKKTRIDSLVLAARAVLDQYPYLLEYLNNTSPLYNALGEPINLQKRQNSTISSYVAYATDRLTAAESAKWCGLIEELPTEYSNPENVLDAVSKRNLNPTVKLFRLIGSEALN